MDYTPNPAFMREWAATSPGLRNALNEAGEVGVAAARAVAPVDTGRYKSGGVPLNGVMYDGIHHEDGGLERGAQTEVVVSEVPYAEWISKLRRHFPIDPLGTAAVEAIERY